MDITLERILSLLPHKPNGNIEHGARKTFAQSVGLKSGNLISDWINGRNKSYYNYIFEIAAKYDVSVAWLKGETDEKKPSLTEEDELIGCLKLLRERPEFRGLLYAVKNSSKEEVEAYTKLIEAMSYFVGSTKTAGKDSSN